MNGTQGSGPGGWQRANIVSAVIYLREQIAKGGQDQRVRAVYEGLMDVLDPTRRAVRQQREMATAAKAAAKTARERRIKRDRRASGDRRRINLGPPADERRSGKDRRFGVDRRATKL